uniref:Retrovirus-related Pol polyprotein from transposon TNT 1-94-like beta-barrel domain-containing protein n=1 Tax=Fagus sylvatica TaxID=28930 RepID=A0A2N9FP95_FAGSY
MSIPSSTPTLNTQTPFFLLSNITNYVTVKLDHTNYLMWKFQITGILDAYSLLDHIEDPIPCPCKFLLSETGAVTQEINPIFLQWKARDKALFSLISATLSPSAISLVMGQTTASGIWKIIVNRYTSVSRSSIVNLKRELNSIKKNSDSVTDYLQKIKEARDKLVSVGVTIDDEEILHIVLQGLSSDFHSFTSAMLTENELVSFEELHTLMKTEEDLLKSAADNSKELTHMAIAANKSSSSTSNNSSTAPFNTQFHAHRGRGGGRNNRGGGRSFYNGGRAKLAAMATAAPFNPNQTTWISDTGATDHFTPDLTNIPDNKAYTDSQLVSVGNGHQLPISHIGNAQLRTSSCLFRLRKVLRVPNIASNLLSVQSFCRDNACSFHFNAHRFQIQDLITGKPLYRGLSKDGLYPIHGLSLPPLESRLSSISSAPSPFQESPHASYMACLPSARQNASLSDLWHMRLGHPQSRAERKSIMKAKLEKAVGVIIPILKIALVSVMQVFMTALAVEIHKRVIGHLVGEKKISKGEG